MVVVLASNNDSGTEVKLPFQVACLIQWRQSVLLSMMLQVSLMKSGGLSDWWEISWFWMFVYVCTQYGITGNNGRLARASARDRTTYCSYNWNVSSVPGSLS